MAFEAFTGIGLLGILQEFRESAPQVIESFFRLVSNPVIYQYLPIAIAAFLLWFVDRRKGDLMLLNMVIAIDLARMVKNVVKQPRPWVLDPSLEDVEGSAHAGGYSFPSGHATAATAGYGTFAMVCGSRPWAVLFVTLAAAIVFSRLYLGAHTPLDVVAGVILALSIICINGRIYAWAQLSDDNYRKASYGYMIALLPVCIAMVCLADRSSGTNALAFALTYGTLVGRHLEHFRYRCPEIVCDTMRKVAQFILGMVPVVICLLVLPMILGHVPGYAVGGAFTGLWVTLLYPLIMRRITAVRGIAAATVQ